MMRPHALRAGLRSLLLSASFLVFASAPVRAEADWFESGDTQLRLDLQLLNDAEIIRYPLNQWPIPRAAIAYAIANAKDHFAQSTAVVAALERVRSRLAPAASRGVSFDTGIRGGEPGLWRDFDTIAREDAELGAGASYANERFAAGLSLTAVTDPADGDELRLDGSHATVKLGNWLLSANMLDRWWGPGHEGSLILSNNARPMPTLMVERAEARPFENRWLSWLGPWRFSLGFSEMENERRDIDRPVFMAWRVAVMPFKDVEIGFSRTAQFCGEQLACSLSVFGNLLVGNDNLGIDATAANEPGNQMAGFDLRWNSPIGNLPYAIYAQYIGEDESSYVPAKYIAQLGLEVWKPLANGALVQSFFEYATTTCSASTGRGPYYNCAYNQGRFSYEGYRYKGRVIGYSADRDAENWALGATFTDVSGALWTATARRSRLNRDDFGDIRNTVASIPTGYDALELGWSGMVFGQRISADLGVESIEPARSEREVGAFGFVGWRYDFQP